MGGGGSPSPLVVLSERRRSTQRRRDPLVDSAQLCIGLNAPSRAVRCSSCSECSRVLIPEQLAKSLSSHSARTPAEERAASGLTPSFPCRPCLAFTSRPFAP